MRVCQFRHSGTIEPSANGWIRQQHLVYKSGPRCQTRPTPCGVLLSVLERREKVYLIG